MCSKEKNIKAIKYICDLVGVEFEESFLSWKSYDLLDPSWDSHHLARASEKRYGWFRRANKSAHFYFVSSCDTFYSTTSFVFLKDFENFDQTLQEKPKVSLKAFSINFFPTTKGPNCFHNCRKLAV